MALPTELHDLDQPASLLDNDKQSRDYLRQIMSRGTLGLNIQRFAAAGNLDYRTFLAICDTTAGAFNLTLPLANYLGTDKTALYIIHHSLGAGAFNVVPSGADTVNGGAAVAIVPGGHMLVFSDGLTNWFVRAI